METFSTIKVQGRNIISLVGGENTRPCAIVDLESLKRLVKYVPNPDLYTTKHGITAQIEQAGNIEEVLDVMRNEIAFRETIVAGLRMNVQDAREIMEFESRISDIP